MSLVGGPGVVGTILAADGELPGWANYGILGVLIVALVVTRQIVPGWVNARNEEEIKELRKEKNDLINLVFDTQKATLPVMEKQNTVLQEAMEEIRTLRRQPRE